MKQHDRRTVGIYCRLSRHDDSDSESESIANQKKMITRYARARGWNIYDYYIDDGISGTTFNRPDFIRMIKDIDSKKLDTVITKDLSRLGRYCKEDFYNGSTGVWPESYSQSIEFRRYPESYYVCKRKWIELC